MFDWGRFLNYKMTTQPYRGIAEWWLVYTDRHPTRLTANQVVLTRSTAESSVEHRNHGTEQVVTSRPGSIRGCYIHGGALVLAPGGGIVSLVDADCISCREFDNRPCDRRYRPRKRPNKRRSSSRVVYEPGLPALHSRRTAVIAAMVTLNAQLIVTQSERRLW